MDKIDKNLENVKGGTGRGEAVFSKKDLAVIQDELVAQEGSAVIADAVKREVDEKSITCLEEIRG